MQEMADHKKFEKKIFSGSDERAIGFVLRVLGTICDGQHKGLQVDYIQVVSLATVFWILLQKGLILKDNYEKMHIRDGNKVKC